MSTIFEIPLNAGQPQTVIVNLNGVQYRLTFKYINCDQGGWIVDISLANGAPLINGIPLVTGVDLLAQYAYKNMGGSLRVQTVDINVPHTFGTNMYNNTYEIVATPDTPPTFGNLGAGSKVFWVAP